MKFFSSKVTLYFYKSTTQPSMEYVFMPGPVLAVANLVCWISYRNRYTGLLALHLLLLLNPCLTVEIQPAEVFSIGISAVDVHLNWLNWFHFLIFMGGPLVILKDCMICLCPFLDVKRMSVSTVFFLAQQGSGIICLQIAFL